MYLRTFIKGSIASSACAYHHLSASSYVKLTRVARKCSPSCLKTRSPSWLPSGNTRQGTRRKPAAYSSNLNHIHISSSIYGDPKALTCDIETRTLLCNAEEQPGTTKPRIPKPIHQFDNGQGTAFVVLEYIKLVDSLQVDDLNKRISDAVTWLSAVQAPSHHKLGPLGGGYIRHTFFMFEDYEAPLPFVDVKALQRYVDKVCVQY